MNSLHTIHGEPHELVLGGSAWAGYVKSAIARCAPYDSTVLITGPTGTGKELIARAVHAQSVRASAPFIPFDCTTVTGQLFASQLFGHRKGAFTGADYTALGCFRAAHCGTIFLDEIGELDPDLQAKLLRVLQERVVVPLGTHEEIPVDVRVVCATNRDLKQEVAKGRFREDLYFRLSVIALEAVGLKQRPQDIQALAEHFLRQLVERSGFPRKRFSPGALEMLTTFDWPGNVRQLRHFIEQAVIASDTELITLPLVQQLLEQARMPVSAEGRAASVSAATDEPHAAAKAFAVAPACLAHGEAISTTAWKTLEHLERDHIRTTLEHTYYNQSAAARLLGISRHALIRKLKRYRIQLPTK